MAAEPQFAESYTISPAEAASMSRSFVNDHDEDCLCTICNCGAHRCPPDRIQGHYNNLRTEHQSQFQGEYIPPPKAPKKVYVHQPRPFEGNTTHQEDYRNWRGAVPRKPAEAARRNNGVFNNNLPFDGVTTNQYDFRRWNSAPAKLAKQANTRPIYVPDNRDFQTEGSAQFDRKNARPRQSCAPAQNANPSLPFEGRTTQQADFIKYRNAKAARSTQLRRTFKPRREDREFSTEARGQFVEKEFDTCPATPLYTKRKSSNGHVTVEQIPDGTWRYTATSALPSMHSTVSMQSTALPSVRQAMPQAY